MDDRSDWQLLSDHLDNTAALAARRGAPIGLESCAQLAGQFHDFGKYDPAFDGRLLGKNLRVDHSTAGANLLCKRATAATMPAAEVLAYAILGHHAGLPDRNGSEPSFSRRIETFRDQIAPEITADAQVDLTIAARELLAKLRQGPAAAFDLSLAARMVFSCLVDADFRDTEAFYSSLDHRIPDRDWPELAAILPDLTGRFDAHMERLAKDSDLNRLRTEILTHIRDRARLAPGLFTLTVPTGGGKTLASMGFALDHAARHGHRRIIYAIPYTSIIDQTAAIFRNLFGDLVLEHHSVIDDQRAPEGRDKLRLAMEDWAAPIVVTTNVQFFESLFAARPSRCRKLHHIAGSIIILDEAQCLPRKLLMPALRMIDTLCAHYGCSVVLCTATQPAFDSRQLKPGGLPLEGRELAPDPEALADRLRRTRILRAGEMDDTALIAALQATPQGLVIVNSRAHALDLFNAAKAKGLDGVIHLTTRQYPVHRRAILDDIRKRLSGGAPCRLIATSLIEAGVDLDFPKGWRAEAGLDACVQAAGRINRNGERPVEDSTLTIFAAPGRSSPAEVRSLAEAMHRTADTHDDLLSPAAIRDWFEHVYWKAGADRLGQPMVAAFQFGRGGTDFPFRKTAEEFRMIASTMVPVIIRGDEVARRAVDKLGIGDIPSGLIARELQVYTVQVPERSRALLVENGKARFHHPNLRGDQFCVLEEESLYHADCGLWWEDADYLAAEDCLI